MKYLIFFVVKVRQLKQLFIKYIACTAILYQCITNIKETVSVKKLQLSFETLQINHKQRFVCWFNIHLFVNKISILQR